MARIEAEDVGLHNLSPKPGSRKNRKRVGRGTRLRHRQDLRSRPQGRGLPRGRQAARPPRGRPEPDPHADAQAAWPQQEDVDAVREVPDAHPAGQPGDLEARFDAGAEVTPETLKAAGLATRKHPVKVLGNGEISKKLTVRAHAFSATASEKIEAAGGSAETIEADRRDG